MTPGELLLLAWCLFATAVTIVAIAYAVHMSPVPQFGERFSLDCMAGIHGGCQVCDGCECHAAVTV